jgi:hypothetical protein
VNDPKPTMPEKPYFSWVMMSIGGLLTLLGIYHFGAGVFEWLRNGQALDPSLREVLWREGITPQPVSWVGIQRIIDWYLSLSASVAFFLTGFAIVVFWGWLAGYADDERTRIRGELREWEIRNNVPLDKRSTK